MLDFINKACECLDLIGWEHASTVLPSVVDQMVAARGAEETTAWRHPLDLVALCEEAAAELRDLFTTARQPAWADHTELAVAILGDDARTILESLMAAVRAGALPADLGRSLAYAAALRVARFGTSNEHADWETALHVFTYANAMHQVLKRIGIEESERTGGIEAVRGVLHGAMALYLARYLNVPPIVCQAKAATGWTTSRPTLGPSARLCWRLSIANGRSTWSAVWSRAILRSATRPMSL